MGCCASGSNPVVVNRALPDTIRASLNLSLLGMCEALEAIMELGNFDPQRRDLDNTRRAGRYTHTLGSREHVVNDARAEAEELLGVVRRSVRGCGAPGYEGDPDRPALDEGERADFTVRRRVAALIMVHRPALERSHPHLSDALDVPLVNSCLPVRMVRTQLRRGAELFNAVDRGKRGYVSRAEILAWVADQGPTDVAESSVLIDALLEAVQPSAARRGEQGARAREWNAEEFVVWAHTVCAYTHRALADVAFAVLATARTENGDPAVPAVKLRELLDPRRYRTERQPVDDAVLARALASVSLASTTGRTAAERLHGRASGFDVVAAAIVEAGVEFFPLRAHEALVTHSTQYLASIVLFQNVFRAAWVARPDWNAISATAVRQVRGLLWPRSVFREAPSAEGGVETVVAAPVNLAGGHVVESAPALAQGAQRGKARGR